MPFQVSVVLPFHNAQATLGRAIESMVHQSFSDWELILINHASTDQSADIAQAWAQQDTRLCVVNEYETGLVSALNRGLREANAPLVARMDADDVAYPDRLAQQLHYLNDHPAVGAVGCVVRYCAADESTQIGMDTYVHWVNTIISSEAIRLNRFVESPLVHPSVMFRTQLIDQYGFYRPGNFPEDYELWLRWLSHGVTLAKVPHILLDWYDSPSRLSRTNHRYSSEAFYRIKTDYLVDWLERRNPFHPNVVVWGGGRKTRQRIHMLEAQDVCVQAIIDVVPHKTSLYPCIFYQDVAPPNQYFVLSYVSNRGQRDEIRQFLLERGYHEGEHFLLVA